MLLVLMFGNTAITDEIDTIKPKYRCEFESGWGIATKIITVFKKLPNDNFLMTAWSTKPKTVTETKIGRIVTGLTKEEWFDETRLTHLNDGVFEWYDNSGSLGGDDQVVLNTFYFGDEVLYNGQLAFESRGVKINYFTSMMLGILEKKANKAKRSDMGGEKHIKLENKFFEAAKKAQKKFRKDVKNLMLMGLYLCKPL